MAASPETLTDRMRARVKLARLDVDRRATATRPKAKRGRLRLADTDSPKSGETPETQSLKRVFRDMGIAYRRHRRRTREPVVPGLREAAYSFRAEPTLASLVTVAEFLEELELLD
jgi:hypothetical protein